MSRHLRVQAQAIFVLGILWLGLASAAEPWPTTQFEVFVGTPNLTYSVGGRAIQKATEDWIDLDEPAPLSRAPQDLPGTVAEIELLLADMAGELQRMGFRAPTLEPLVERADGSLAYRVYLMDAPGKAPAWYGQDDSCSDQMRPWVGINGLALVPTGLSDKAYQDIPHELFHAIQRSYPILGDNCGLGDWLVEGTAQAIGADLAAWSRHRKNYPNRGGIWRRDRWGWRNYEVPLWRPDDNDARYAGMFDQNDAYGTSSFWRYLGEHVALSGGAGLTSVKPDYRYLAEWFEVSLPGPAGPDSEIEWLEARLRTDQRFRLGLSRIYPNFITTFASYVPGRFKESRHKPIVAQDYWLERLFPSDDCPDARLGGQQSEYTGTLAINKNAASCLRLMLDYDKPVDLHIEVRGAPLERLRALSVGTAQGRVVARPLIKGLRGESSASFVLHIDDPSPEVPWPLVFSNVSSQPEFSEPINATVRIVSASFTHNMLPGPAKKATRPKARPPAGDEPAGEVNLETQTRSVGDELDRGLDDMNPNLADGGTVFSNPDQPPCRDAFVTQACGPSTSISLVTVAGILSSVSQATGRGGAFGQFMSMLSGVADVGPLEATERYQESLERAAQYDGSSVNIVIPLIDYGFTGSFDNAYITVSKKGDGEYESIGPADIQPGPGQLFPLSGRVTIEEYSTAVMRGTFSAALVDREDIAELGDDGSLPVRHDIAGRFQIAVPWMEDGRVHRETPESLDIEVTEDLAGISPELDAWLESIAEEQARDDAGGGDSTGGTLPGCYCACNAPDAVREACSEQCAPTIAACAGQQATADTLAGLAFQPKRVDATAAQAEGEPWLPGVPDAQTWLDQDTAARLLDASEARRVVGEWIEAAYSQVDWRAGGGQQGATSLRLMFQGLDSHDSRNLPAEELKMAALGFNALQARSIEQIDGLGNIAFLADLGDSTALIVLTGIYGKAWDSDDFGTELVVSYSLAKPDLDHDIRGERLVQMARPQIEELLASAQRRP